MPAVVTCMPNERIFIAGRHEYMPHNPEPLADYYLDSEPALSRVRYRPQCDNAHKDLIQTYCKLHAIRAKFTPLDSMFKPLFIDDLRHTHVFTHRGTLPAIRRYGLTTFEHKSCQIPFDLRDTAKPYAVPHDLSADGNFETLFPDVACALLKRERDARDALKQIRYYYIKNAGNGEAKFRTAAPDNDAQRIVVPDAEAITEIHHCCIAFHTPSNLQLDRFACSLNTAKKIAQNLGSNLTSLQKDCIANGGVCDFPGLTGSTVAISSECPDDVLYAVSGASRSLFQAEGPKILKQSHSGTCTVLDYYQYKCIRDLPDDRQFGCIIELKEPCVND